MQTQKIGKTATNVFRNTKGELCVMYHETIVYKETVNATIQLNTGGWYTATTKSRMNQAFNQFKRNYSVFQKNNVWFVRNRKTGEIIAFKDLMELPII